MQESSLNFNKFHLLTTVLIILDSNLDLNHKAAFLASEEQLGTG